MALYGEAKREYQRKWMAQRRQDWIDSQGGKCVDCGSTENLEVDHVDPTTKEFNPTRIWSRKKEVRDAELVKCVVRCSKCHLLKTIAWKRRNSKHGTPSEYGYGCRCDLCREAATIDRRRYARTK